MRWNRLVWQLALAVVPLIAARETLAAQRWERPVGVAAGAATGGRAELAPRPDSAPVPTTLGQRYVLGLALGGAAGMVVGQSVDDGAIALAAFLAGSAGGVLLAGHAREGARPVPVLLGTLLGASPIWLVLADDRPSDGPDERLLFFFIGVLTTPFGGAVGHELGGPRPAGGR